MAPHSFDSMIATNLTGVFNGVHTFAAGMRAQGHGHILNTASTAGLMVNANGCLHSGKVCNGGYE